MSSLLDSFRVIEYLVDIVTLGASLVAQSVKNLPAMRESAFNAGDLGSFRGLGRCPGEGNGNPFKYSCLGNAMDRGTCRPTVHWVAQESYRTQQLNTYHNIL